jgi:hypothetical protein
MPLYRVFLERPDGFVVLGSDLPSRSDAARFVRMMRNLQSPARRAEARRRGERLVVEEQAGPNKLSSYRSLGLAQRYALQHAKGRPRGRAAPLHSHTHGRRQR